MLHNEVKYIFFEAALESLQICLCQNVLTKTNTSKSVVIFGLIDDTVESRFKEARFKKESRFKKGFC